MICCITVKGISCSLPYSYINLIQIIFKLNLSFLPIFWDLLLFKSFIHFLSFS